MSTARMEAVRLGTWPLSAAAPAQRSARMRDLEEIVLLRRCQAGNPEAFRTLVERYQRRIFWVAYGMVGNAQVSEDIAQEAFVRVLRNLSRFDLNRNFYTWFYQIVVNLAIDHLRRAGRQKSVDFEGYGGIPDDRIDPSDFTNRVELKERVKRVLDRLPPKYKAVLTLRDLHGLSCQEIAQILGTNHATARWRLHRARRLFKAIWVGQTVQTELEE